MENASKALIMAASILLGVMIISVGVALFNSFGGFGRNITNEIDKNKIAEFNSQFLKYYGKSYDADTGKNEYIKLTTHDIVTLANLAQKNNIEYGVQEQNGKSEKSYYIQIALGKKQTNLEKYSENELLSFIQDNMINETQDNIKYYYVENVEISSITGRVIFMQLQEL